MDFIGNQLAMVYPDGGALIDITGPEDDCPTAASVNGLGGVIGTLMAQGPPQPVLQQELASPNATEPAQVDDLISQIAARPGIGG